MCGVLAAPISGASVCFSRTSRRGPPLHRLGAWRRPASRGATGLGLCPSHGVGFDRTCLSPVTRFGSGDGSRDGPCAYLPLFAIRTGTRENWILHGSLVGDINLNIVYINRSVLFEERFLFPRMDVGTCYLKCRNVGSVRVYHGLGAVFTIDSLAMWPRYMRLYLHTSPFSCSLTRVMNSYALRTSFGGNTATGPIHETSVPLLCTQICGVANKC